MPIDLDEFDAFYDRYREHCEQAGIELRSREHVLELVSSWERMGLVPPSDQLRVTRTAASRVH